MHQSVPLRALFCLALALAVVIPSLATAGDEDQPGKKAFVAQKCGRCHSIESEGIEATVSEKMRGPALDQPTERRDREWLARYLRREEKIADQQHRATWKGTDEELQSIIDWLLVIAPEG